MSFEGSSGRQQLQKQCHVLVNGVHESFIHMGGRNPVWKRVTHRPWIVGQEMVESPGRAALELCGGRTKAALYGMGSCAGCA